MNQNPDHVVKIKTNNNYDQKKQSVSISSNLPINVWGIAFNVYQIIDKKEYYKFIVNINLAHPIWTMYTITANSTLVSADSSMVIHPEDDFKTGTGKTILFKEAVSATYLIPVEFVKLNYYNLKLNLGLKLIGAFGHGYDGKIDFPVNTSLKTESKNNSVDVTNAITEFSMTTRKNGTGHQTKTFSAAGMKIDNVVQNWNDRLDFTLTIQWKFYGILEKDQQFLDANIDRLVSELNEGKRIEFNLDDSSEIKYFKTNYLIPVLASSKTAEGFSEKISTTNQTVFDSRAQRVEESDPGTSGILLNPNDKWQNEFVRNIQISNINYSVSQITLIPQKTYEIISSEQLNFTNFSEYQINYQMNAWNKFYENQQGLALKFIKAHEKQLF
ncbi:hypothetical protein SCLARK_00431 [Spiroplasma clarkii]|uniref:Uncharacterized protein n=1 Tax=Spiroplasma clarkii TaxID=2139 RepID=A0A1Y0KZK3_9MOLU|nr:hypothetical protein [Spiroplasma clarkii]ARU91153.1 hypothetical protein SCLARK_00431 [Spiroplasma clarkii]ATX70592.1 hypothetical protein SCLAR_v1c02620 [Spiroplasma clarkii]